MAQIQGAEAVYDRMVELRRDFHRHPELAFEEERTARAIMAELYEHKLLTPAPFDEPIEFTYWELWHDEGARARHGAAMASPNHAWWEGMYVVGRNFYARFLPHVDNNWDFAELLSETLVKVPTHHRCSQVIDAA